MSMLYISTRGQAAPASFAQVLLAGLAPDGGLYVPQSWPAFSPEDLRDLAGRPYAHVAAQVLSRFTGDAFTGAQLDEMCADAYATFAHPAVTPLRQLDADLWMLELHHGPTLAFKDVAMQILARMYDAVLHGTGRTLTIVCATSGDTGGAAVEAFRGARHARIVVLFPHERISEVQRRFMTTTRDNNVRTVAVDGTFDDCQAIVKSLFADERFRTDVDLSGVNSINWARVAAQAVYYFTSALALGAPDRAVRFVTPTGNFGDALAGFVAHRLGLPMAGIVAATNRNDIVARALDAGRYVRGEVCATQSPAMDIQVASNFERLYFEAVRRDGVETARAFRAFAKEGGIDLPPGAFAMMQELFSGISVSEADTTRTLVSVLNETGALVDPHTAVGLAAARQMADAEEDTSVPTVVLSTAHPAKFPDAVKAATGLDPDLHPRCRGLMDKVERIDRLPADADAIKSYVRAFAKG
jgi:threonine synthase